MRLVIEQNGVPAPFAEVNGECVVSLTDLYLASAALDANDDLVLTMNDATQYIVPLGSTFYTVWNLPVVLIPDETGIALGQVNELDTSAGPVIVNLQSYLSYAEGDLLIFRREGASNLTIAPFGGETINGGAFLILSQENHVVWLSRIVGGWKAVADYDLGGGGSGDPSLFTFEPNEAFWGSNTAVIAGDARGARSIDIQGDRASANQVASGEGSIAIGNSVRSLGQFSVSIGQSVTAVDGTGERSVAIGAYAIVDAGYSVGIGPNTIVPTTSESGVAIGNSVSIAANSPNSAAIGNQAIVAGGVNGGVAIGSASYVSQTASIAIGSGAYAGPNNLASESGVAIGSGATVPANSPGGIAIGDGANLVATPGADSPGRIAIGEGASVSAGADGGIAIGDGAISSEPDSVIIGNGAYNGSGAGVVAIGAGSSGAGNNCVILGKSSNATSHGVGIGYLSSSSDNAVSIGRNPLAGSDSSVSIGNAPVAQSSNSIAIGTSANVGTVSDSSISIGDQSSVAGNSQHAIAIGSGAGILTDQSPHAIAIGRSASVETYSTASIAIGSTAQVKAGSMNSISIGYASSVGLSSYASTCVGYNSVVGDYAAGSVAIGVQASALHAGSVAVGLNISSTAISQATFGWGSGSTQKIVLDNGQLTVPALDVNGHITEQVTTVSTGSNYVINMAIGTVWAITLTASITISFSNVVAGRSCTVNLIQGGGGSNVVTWTGVTWPNGVVPTLSTTVGDRDKLVFDSYNGTAIDGSLAGLDYS
jgi:hypothetical protein